MPEARVTIDRGDVGVRIDRVLLRHLRHLPGVTRNRLQRLLSEGAVRVNARAVTRASARVAAHDDIVIDLPELRPRTRPAAEALPLDVLYEDDSLLIVNKPAGQVAHPAFRNTSGTLLNALLGYAADRWTPALLTRLDKDTSGLVLVAKTRLMQAALQRLAERAGIEKDYLAIVTGRPPAKGTIDLSLDRDPWDKRRVTVRDRGGVPSVTQFERLRSRAAMRVEPSLGEVTLSLMRCRLVTGRTHQIRVHFAAKGWPIVGDAVYGFAGRKPRAPSAPDIQRQALHAWRLAFSHPLTEARIETIAPIPADMQRLLDGMELSGGSQSSTRARSSSTEPSAE
jgi:23S rRNA pseudouridine1911/1915/1917 synthase